MNLPAAPQPVLLVIADISGYTRYMTANAKTLAHSQTIITELVEAIIRHIELPLEIAKLEGDAVFMYCRKQADSPPEAKRILGGKLLAFFDAFGEKVRELSGSVTCTCQACAHIETLRLKVIAHSGEVLFHRVASFTELAGVDVIILHRLLKNSVRADQYLLLTEPARRDLDFPSPISLTESAESYDDIGRIKTLVFLPDGQPAAVTPLTLPFGERFAASWKLFAKLWFAPFASSKGAFRNVTTGSGQAGRYAFAGITVLLTPLLLPVGTIFVLIHALRSAPTIRHAADCHEHKADSSCCREH